MTPLNIAETRGKRLISWVDLGLGRVMHRSVHVWKAAVRGGILAEADLFTHRLQSKPDGKEENGHSQHAKRPPQRQLWNVLNSRLKV